MNKLISKREIKFLERLVKSCKVSDILDELSCICSDMEDELDDPTEAEKYGSASCVLDHAATDIDRQIGL